MTEMKRLASLCLFSCAAPLVLVVVLVLDFFAVGSLVSFVHGLFSAQTPANQRRSKTEDENDDEDEDD